jgi:type I restriction enzyme M protein
MAKEIKIPEGYIQDFISGKPLKDTAKEYIRQDMAKVLFHEYRFEPQEMERDYPIPIETEEGKKRRYKIDIAVFPPELPDHSDHQNIIRLIQIEAPRTPSNNKKRGVSLLQEMMIACRDCEFGLWTNGETERRAFRKIEKRFDWAFEEIIDIPGSGQTLEDVDNFTKDDLKVAVGESLLQTFKRCHNYIAANQGVKKDQAFWELLKLIFCKIYDERTKGLEFRVRSVERNSRDGQQRVMGRISGLFEKVKQTYNHIFRESDEIFLNHRVVAYIASQIQGYDFLNSPVDVKGTAYEEIVGANLKGDRGQFFTPRNVVKMAVTILHPNETHHILDPACGTGGFLIESLTHVIEQISCDEQSQWADPKHASPEEKAARKERIGSYAASHIYGVDFDPDLVKATQMNMVMNNDGQGHLFSVNSLDNPHNWPKDVRKTLRLESMDIVLTNPPFGSKLEIDDPSMLEMYELARKWEKREDGTWWPTGNYQKKIPPEVLFIERCWQFLKPGTGRMGIVLPDGILSNPDLEYVRTWILRNCRVLASIDLPVETFLPHTGTQTSMLFLQRKPKLAGLHARIAGDEEVYPVFMAIAEKVGKDRRANPVYQRDPHGNELWFDQVEEEDVWVEEPLAEPPVDNHSGTGLIVREHQGQYFVRRRETRQVTHQVRRLDDDLPLIAEAFRKFSEEQHLEN